MGTLSWLLTDVEQRVWLEQFAIGPRETGVGAGTAWSIRKSVLRGGLCDGVDFIEVDNGAFRFSLVPTRGMGLWRGDYRGLPVGWQAPIKGPVHPHHVHLTERGGLGWLSGFDEAIVRCGLDWTGGPGCDVATNNQGARVQTPHTLHGRIANLPASRVAVEVIPGEVPELVVTGEVEEAALFLPQFTLRTRIRTALGSNVVHIRDEIVNRKSAPAEMELLYHCNFGPPFLEEGAELLLPSRLVAPRDAHAATEIATCGRYGPPTPGYVERCYWYEPLGDADGDSLAMLRNAAADRAVIVRFNVAQLPYFTQWKNIGPLAEGYVTGLEPGTDYPNAKPFEREQGRLCVIPAGGSHVAELALEVRDSAAGVAQATREIATLQRRAKRQVAKRPLATHTPA